MEKILLVILLFILVGVIFYFVSQKYSIYGNKIKAVSINSQKFKLEIVKNPLKISRGLGGRKSLCNNCGMLFEFPQTGNYSFWMKGMNFSLDIIWILEGKVVYVAKCNSPDYKGLINPKVSANEVLEINAGMVENCNIKIGDKIILV